MRLQVPNHKIFSNFRVVKHFPTAIHILFPNVLVLSHDISRRKNTAELPNQWSPQKMKDIPQKTLPVLCTFFVCDEQFSLKEFFHPFKVSKARIQNQNHHRSLRAHGLHSTAVKNNDVATQQRHSQQFAKYSFKMHPTFKWVCQLNIIKITYSCIAFTILAEELPTFQRQRPTWWRVL